MTSPDSKTFHISPEDRIRAAQSPQEVGLVLIALAGEGLGLSQMVEAIVDAKVEESHLPKGTNRAEVKKGLMTIFDALFHK